MSGNCNNTTSVPLCGTCVPSTDSTNLSGCTTGCLDIYDTSCINYDGQNLSCLGVNTNTLLNDAFCSINNQICVLQSETGLVKVNSLDSNPGTLLDKLLAGSNIILTGVGSGDSLKIRIDSVEGGSVIDQYVKVSATDQTAGYLEDKLAVGPCVYIQKLNPGLNEKLQINIDWQCVLNQLSLLPGLCTVVSNCVPTSTPILCPYVVLNNPNINGNTITATWLSSGTSFNVYVDGVLQPSMPTSSLTYTSGTLTNGSHTVEVVALCSTGAPNRDSQTFMINTACSVPNQLTANILSGAASLTWALATNSNNSNQTVQYKFSTASGWTTATSLSPVTTSYNITGLNQNRLYNFQIINNCATGGPSPSTPVTSIEFTCPTVTLTSTSNNVGFSFVNLGGDIDTYLVEIYDSGNNLIQSKNITGPFGPSISDTFSGLNSLTTYQVKVTVKAGSYSKACGLSSITTTNVPSCPAPTNFTGTIS